MDHEFLRKEKSPRILVNGVRLTGVKEIVGPKHNTIILGWADKLGIGNIYTNDEIPWCGLYMAWVCHISKVSINMPAKDSLWALNWNKFGVRQKVAMLGDVLTFSRPGGGGHVGIYVGEDDLFYHILGGNQSNMVNVTRIAKSRLSQIRRTKWKIAQPANVRVIKLTASGLVSKNEA
jgi:uncharacterized protein (TIGR02594 family)